jgi:flagellar FliJ protein
MTKWAASLIRISTHEVETLQKRLADIVERRMAAELRVAMLDAEGEAEAKQAEGCVEQGWYMIGYREGAKRRRSEMMLQIEQSQIEEQGARDALSFAFEALKKYEHVAEAAKVAQVKKMNVFESAQLDELGLRRTGTHGR